MQLMLRVLVAYAVATLLAVGASSPQVVNLGQGNGAEQKVVVKEGETFEVKVNGNPTTGYSWAVAPLATDNVEQVAEKQGECAYKVNSHPPGFVGVPGVFTCTFKAKKVGQEVINLSYARPWEKNVAAAETAKVDVTVVAKGANAVELEQARFAADSQHDQRWTEPGHAGR